MGLGSLFETVISPLGGFGGVGGKTDSFLGKFTGGSSSGEAFLSGIPIFGDSFAAQQQQKFNSAEALKAREHGSAEARLNRDWQAMMSGTAHQRQADDMQKAGLNRILAVGSGASTPSGATGATATASGQAGSGASSSANMLRDQMNLVRKQAKEKIISEKLEQDNKKQLNKNLKSQELVHKANAKQVDANTKATQYDNVGKKLDADLNQSLSDLTQSAGVTGGSAKSFGGILQSIGKALGFGAKAIKKTPFKKKQKWDTSTGKIPRTKEGYVKPNRNF